MTEGPVGWGPLGGGLWAHRDQWEGVDLLGGVKQSQRLRKSQVRAEKDPNTNFPVLGGTLLSPQFPKAKAAATQEPRTTTHQILLQCELYMGETNTWERVTGSTSHLRLNGIPTSSTAEKVFMGPSVMDGVMNLQRFSTTSDINYKPGAYFPGLAQGFLPLSHPTRSGLIPNRSVSHSPHSLPSLSPSCPHPPVSFTRDSVSVFLFPLCYGLNYVFPKFPFSPNLSECNSVWR